VLFRGGVRGERGRLVGSHTCLEAFIKAPVPLGSTAQFRAVTAGGGLIISPSTGKGKSSRRRTIPEMSETISLIGSRLTLPVRLHDLRGLQGGRTLSRVE